MNELATTTTKNIESMIHEIRGQQVMLDSDLAKLFQCKNGTKEINQAVSRNKDRFLKEFTWKLNDDGIETFLVTNCDQKTETRGGRYKNPRVFTMQGITMLSKIMRNPNVKEITPLIIEAFSNLTKPNITNVPKIEGLIHTVRGKEIMLDIDLGELYQCKNGSKTINQAVKRHIERFPEDFCFQLTREEYMEILRSQVGTLELKQGEYSKYLPYAFTEQGVAMLATILRTPVAALVSINIMRAFIAMRKYISTNLIEQKYINGLVLKHESEISTLQKTFNKFEEKKKVNEIYFEGQIYDAYSKLTDIMKEAKKKLTIVDGYADKSVLDMISSISVPTTLIVKNKGLLKDLDIQKYFEQYDNLIVIHDDTFHDRYIVIDDHKVYHCGASLNHAGSKVFSINKLEDEGVVEFLLSKINDVLN